MNRVHNLICSSGWWSRRVETELLPWGLKGCEPGDDVLELDERYCRRLASELGDRVTVVQGDATRLPFADGRFSAAVCFTMLHHIPSEELQNQAFSEVARVLRPGGLFAGTDSLGTGRLFKLIHVGDVLKPIDPDSLPARLQAAGLTAPRVTIGGRSMRFTARTAA